MWTAKTLIRLSGCPGWYESSLGAHAWRWAYTLGAHAHVGFVTRRLTFKSVYELFRPYLRDLACLKEPSYNLSLIIPGIQTCLKSTAQENIIVHESYFTLVHLLTHAWVCFDFIYLCNPSWSLPFSPQEKQPIAYSFQRAFHFSLQSFCLWYITKMESEIFFLSNL